jgi:SH3-like domain-containing protein
MRTPVIALLGLLALTLSPAAAAQDEPPQDDPCWDGEGDTPTGLCVPRFVSLKFDSANGRAGPSRRHPIAWRYQRAGLPMEVIAETTDWRRVRDPEGELTWMRRNLLSGRRSVFAREDTVLRARADEDAGVAAIAEAGAVLTLERCRAGWCRLEGQGLRGWARTDTLWGVYAHERAQDAGEARAGTVDGGDALSAPAPRDTALR